MRVLIVIAVSFFILSCSSVEEKDSEKQPVYSGVRSSRYGIEPFPDPEGWLKAIRYINESFKRSTPSAIWIVGQISTVGEESNCVLSFDRGNLPEYKNVKYMMGTDYNKEYLDLFDKKGIKVFLQVEPGDADVNDLIKAVMSRYKHHKCVIGFGVDIEWYQIKGTDGYGTRVTNELASSWDSTLKAQGNYQLFLKHWDPDWMPPDYRSDIIFVDDSQGFMSMAQMVSEFNRQWSDLFYPNTVFFQIGYESDKKIWQEFDNPPEGMADRLGKNVMQDFGIFWVDFTLNKVAPVK